MMASAKQQPTDVVFFGNLDPRVTKSMLHELSVQVRRFRSCMVRTADAVLQRSPSSAGHFASFHG